MPARSGRTLSTSACCTVVALGAYRVAPATHLITHNGIHNVCNLPTANCNVQLATLVAFHKYSKRERKKNGNCTITSCILCSSCVFLVEFLERPTFVLGCCLRWLLDSLFVLAPGPVLHKFGSVFIFFFLFHGCLQHEVNDQLATGNLQLQLATGNSSLLLLHNFLSSIYRYIYAKSHRN